jgi:hypothetical protein
MHLHCVSTIGTGIECIVTEACVSALAPGRAPFSIAARRMEFCEHPLRYSGYPLNHHSPSTPSTLYSKGLLVRVPCVPQELSTVRRATSRCAQVAARAELDVDLHACAPALLEREEAAILLQQKLTKAIRPRTPCHAAHAHAYTCTHAGWTEGPDWAVYWTAR